MKTVFIQGAVKEEIDILIDNLPNGKWKEHNTYRFYEVNDDNVRIVIGVTQIGIMNASISTMIAAQIYQPDYVINQGTCGAHKAHLKVGDIIVGDRAVYLGRVTTPIKHRGEGSDSLTWKTIMCEYDGSAELSKLSGEIKYDGSVYHGIIGTSDFFTREVDRIEKLTEEFNELCEDMESVAVYKACNAMNIPVIAIRIISNNEITGERDVNAEYGIFRNSQEMLQKYIQNYVAKLCGINM